MLEIEKMKRTIGKKPELLSNILALLVLMFAFTLFNKDFIAPRNISDFIRAFSFLGIAALGQTMVMISGGIDLSVGGIAGLSAITAGYLMDKIALHPYFVVIVGIAIGLACGMLNGFIVAKLKIVPFVATLGTMEIFFGLVMVITRGYPIFTIPKEVQNLASSYVIGVPLPIVVFLGMAVLCHYFLNYTNFGRNIYTVGGNVQAAKICGIPVEKTQWLVYSSSGVLAGIGGLLALSWLGSGQPTIGQDWLMTTIAATIIGGTTLTGGEGTVVGTVIGVILLGCLDNGLTMVHVSPYWRGSIRGVVVILAVLIDVLRDRGQD